MPTKAPKGEKKGFHLLDESINTTHTSGLTFYGLHVQLLVEEYTLYSLPAQ